MDKQEPLLFDDLRVLRSAEQLADKIWRQVTKWTQFAREIVGGQLARAVDSIGANIAEAFGRYNYGEKLQFLYYARGSLFEAKYWINRGTARQLITKEQGEIYAGQLTVLARELNAFTQAIKTQRSTTQPNSRSSKQLRESPVEYITNPVNNPEAVDPLFSDADLQSLQDNSPTSNPKYPIPTTQYLLPNTK